MDEAKLARLVGSHILRCTACFATNLDIGSVDLVCPDCGARFPFSDDGAVNFLDSATSARYQIEETDNVSDHPFDGNALALIEAAADGLVLDCGSGYKSDAFDNVIQLEIVNYPNVDVLGVNQRLPFATSCFDVVFSADVLEHVDDPFKSAAEILRVLKPGGVLYVDLPFLQPEHGYPNHYFNATRQGLQRLFSEMTVIEHHVPLSGHPILTLHWFLHEYQNGLPESTREAFLAMTMGQLLERPAAEWLDSALAAELSEDAQWLIASTTQAILQKEGNGAVDLGDVVGELPGFGKRCRLLRPHS